MRQAAILLLTILVVPCCYSDIIYVDDDAPTGGNGQSWNTSYKYLQDALLTDAVSGDTIRLGAGSYVPDEDENGNVTLSDRDATFSLINGVTIEGGYAGYGQPDPNERAIDLYESILSGDLNGDDNPNFVNNGENSYHVVTGSGVDETTILDGLTISGGNANGSYPKSEGGGICNYPGSPTLTDCTFIGNWANIRGGAARGSNGPMVKCRFINNWSGRYGGALYQCGGSITNCVFINNSSGRYGGMMDHCGGLITNCMFIGNSADEYGGGLYECSGPVINCTFIGNSAGYRGGGTYNAFVSGTIINSTFNGNSAGEYGGSIFIALNNMTVVNCILWGNTAGSAGNEIAMRQTSSLTMSYSDVQGGQTAAYVEAGCTLNWGAGNISDNPLFVDAPNGNYHLQPGSQCVDAGTNSPPEGLPATDMDGNPRPIDGDNDGVVIADMGAYENMHYVEPVIALSAYNFNFFGFEEGTNPESQILEIRNWGENELHWSINESCGWLTVTPDSGSSTGEPNDVTISVDTTGMTWGQYTCDLTISDSSAENDPQTVSVNLDITGPIIDLSGTSFNFFAGEGGADPNYQILTITNIGGGTLDWTITETCGWLTVTPDSGSSTGGGDDVTLSVDTTGMMWGQYSCDVTITDPLAENDPQIVIVNLDINGPVIDLSATSFEFISSVEGLGDQELQINNVGAWILDWSISKNCDWLGVNPDSGISVGEPNNVSLSVDISNLNYGDYNCMLTITDPNAENSPQTVDVILHVAPVILDYNAQTYAYAYAETLGYFGFATDSDTDSDSSSNDKSESLAQAEAHYSPLPGWDAEWQKSNTHAEVEGVYDSSGAWIVSSLDGWGEWYWFSEMGGFGTGPGGGTGNGYTSLSGTMEIGIFENCPQGSCGVILNLNATLTGDIPGSWDNWDWYLKVWDSDPNNPLVVLNGANMSAELNVATGEIFNIELFHEAEEDYWWPEAGLDSTLTIDFTVGPNPANLDFDLDVDYADFAIFASQWQGLPGTPSADIAPAGGDNFVNMQDLKLLAENWLWP